jgi:hypothetical protein
MAKRNRSYLDAFPEIFAETVERTARSVSNIRSKLSTPQNLYTPMYFLASEYETLGIAECVLHADIAKSKQNFYRSAKLKEFLILNYDAGGPVAVPKFAVAMNNYHTLFRALLSDNDDLINSLAHLIGGRPEEEAEHGHPFADNVGYAMKYILLGDYTKAQHHVDQLKAIADDPDLAFALGYATVFQGILLSDRQLVNEGLELQLELHKQDPDHQGLPEEIFSLQVLGLAKLALRQGIEVTLDDPITPQSLLQKHHIEYPSLDFLPSV